MKTTWRGCVFVLLGVLTGCTDSTLELSVDVRTDLSLGNEFQSVVVTLVGEGIERRGDGTGDYLNGVRAADFEELEANGSRTVRVDLLDATGGLVVRNEVLVNHREDRGLAVTLTRDCRAVSCADATTCRGGDCVPVDCIDGTQPSCPEPECRQSGDCMAANVCSEAQCGDGVCLYAPRVDACRTSEYCDPDRGCVPVLSIPDAGSPDVGLSMDAGNDVPPMALSAPRGTWPPNGSSTGVWNRQPRFFWESVAGAADYQLQADNSCPLEQGSLCDFASPELDVRTSEVRHDPDETLLDQVAILAERFRWRVRACNDLGCGPWSSERYLEVGSSEMDVDGDGRVDLVVSAAGTLVRLTIEGGGLVPTVQQTLMGDEVIALERGDFNADGFSDVLALTSNGVGAELVVVHYGSEAGLGVAMNVAPPRGAGPLSNVTCAADFDADGFQDVAIRDASMSYVYWGSAAGLESSPLVLTEALSTCGDVDLDGYSDVVVTTGFYGGDTLRSSSTIRNVGGLLPFQFVGDVNQDGYRDAVVAGATNASLVFGNGDGFDGPEMLEVGLNLNSHIQMVSLANVERFGTGHGRMAVWADASFLGERPDMSEGFGGVAYRSGSAPTFLHGPCDCDGLGMEVRFGMDLNGDTYPDLAVAHERGVYFFFGNPGGYGTFERIYEHPAGMRGTSL